MKLVKYIQITQITLIKLLYYWIVGFIKALLPFGVLSRKSVKGQVVLITGSGSGLGRQLALKFGEVGARIVLWDISEKMNMETKVLLDKLGAESFLYTVDLSSSKNIYDTADLVKKTVGDIDILINNAGVVTGKKLLECSDEAIEKTMAVNSNALFYMAKAFLPSMIREGKGHLVTISSLAGLTGVTGLVDYCASKHAAMGFSEALRAELISQDCRDINVTTVCPYYIDTGMFTGVKTYSPILFPILTTDYVANCIIEAVLTNATELLLPKTAYIFMAVKALVPTQVSQILSERFGINRTMDSFSGRT